MAGIDLGKQVGPLPLGAWVVVVGAGLGIAFYTRQSSPTPVIEEDTSMDEGVGEGPGWVAVPPPTYGPNAPEPVTNEEWGRNAINHLISMGYNSSAADSAVRKYLAAENLSVTEYALITEALRRLGSPPVPLPPGNTTPTTPTTNYATKISVSTSPASPRLGSTVVLKANVSWAATGAAKPSGSPSGSVIFVIENKQYSKPLLGGSATHTLYLGRNDRRFRDKIFTWRAAYKGRGNARDVNSPVTTVRLK